MVRPQPLGFCQAFTRCLLWQTTRRDRS